MVEGGPCYRCIDPFRYEDAEGDSEALDLDGANGSIVDCQIIDSIALKICVALLERGQKSGSGAFYDGIEDVSEAVVINSEDYEWGDEILNSLFTLDPEKIPEDMSEEHQRFAQESLDEARTYFRPPVPVWLPHERDEDCPVCARNADSSTEGFPSSSSKGRIEEVSI